MAKVERVSAVYLLGGMAIVALAILFSQIVLPGPDLLWRMYIADAILNGKQLYRDLLEVNPPLWFWAALPAAWLAQNTPILPYHALVGMNVAGVVSASFIVFHLAKKTLGAAPAATVAFGFLFALSLVGVGDLGQREQSLLMACGLWISLLCARQAGHKVAMPIAILVGVMSAYGFALKHYFVLLPLVLEAWLLWHQKRAWRPFRPETVTLAICAMAYALAVWKFTPDFLGRMLDLIQTTYFGFGSWNNWNSLGRKARLLLQGIWILIPIAIMVLTKDRRPFCVAIAIAILACAGIVLLQQKGWSYHFVATFGLAVMLTFLVVHQAFSNQEKGARMALILVASLGLIWNLVAIPALGSAKSRGQPVEPLLKSIVAKEPKDSRIFILSVGPDYAFHPLADAGRLYWSRYYSLWMLPGLLTPNKDPKLEAIRKVEKERVRAEFVEDVQCSRPNLIIGEAGYIGTPDPVRIDTISYLSEDPAFKAWLNSHYLAESKIGPYPVRRINPAAPPPQCSRTPKRP